MQPLDELKQYYANLLIIQYYSQSKARATIEALTQVLFADGIILDVIDGYDVETAVGAQLTVLGKYVGIDRVQNGVVPDRNYFNFIDDSITPADNVLGFTDGSSFVFGYFFDTQAAKYSPYTLTDPEMRTLIKLKIIINSTTSGFKDIKEAVYSSDLDIDVFDTKNMSLTYITGLSLSNVLQVAIYNDLLPRPACCGTVVLSLKYPTTVFGFITYSRETVNIGFSSYSAIHTGSFLSYQDLVVI